MSATGDEIAWEEWIHTGPATLPPPLAVVAGGGSAVPAAQADEDLAAAVGGAAEADEARAEAAEDDAAGDLSHHIAMMGLIQTQGNIEMQQIDMNNDLMNDTSSTDGIVGPA